MNDVAAAAVLVTSTPCDGEAGGVWPTARRIITPAKSASVGFVHDRARSEPTPWTTFTLVTDPGAVVSWVAVIERLAETRRVALAVAGRKRRKCHVPALVGL